MNRNTTLKAWFSAAAMVALLAVPALAETETRQFKSDRLEVHNLVGEVRVESYRGSGFEVEVTVRGADAGRGVVTLDASEDELNIRFPQAKEFVYPAMGRSSAKVGGRDTGWLSKIGVSERVSVTGSGRGLEVWADVVIRAPRGHELQVRNAVGAVIANEVDADLELSTNNGNVTIEGTRGRAQVATGSGNVFARRVEGERVQIATGSGDVEAEDCASDRMEIATGSGDVSASMMDGNRLSVATGSGDVKVMGVAADEANFATGSGGITVELARMGNGDFSFGTGSGDIVLTIPSGASAELHAETDDGEIDVALDSEARFAVRKDDEVRLTVGGGNAKVNLGTGSGDIRIRN